VEKLVTAPPIKVVNVEHNQQPKVCKSKEALSRKCLNVFHKTTLCEALQENAEELSNPMAKP
jgi:hypothetical protein